MDVCIIRETISDDNMNWTQHKALYDLWGAFEKRLYEKNDAQALAAWQSLSLSTPSEEWLQSLSGFCKQKVTEELFCDFIAHSWNALGEALCSSQRDWVLKGEKNPTTQRVEEALWNILAQSARETLEFVPDSHLETVFGPGAKGWQVLEMTFPHSFFSGFISTLEYLRSTPLSQTPSAVYSATEFPWERLDHVSEQIIEVTGVGMGIAPQLLIQALTDVEKIVARIRTSIDATQLSEMDWAALNLLRPVYQQTVAGLHTGITNVIDLYVGDDISVPIVDILAHEWGHALEYQVGHSNCTLVADPRLSSIQAPMEQLVNAIMNTPQCPRAAKDFHESVTDEIIDNITTHLTNFGVCVSEAQTLAPAVWEKAVGCQDVHSLLDESGVSDILGVENRVQNLVHIYSDFKKQLAEGKSVWISYSLFTDDLVQLQDSAGEKVGYWGNPNEIFARAIEAALPYVLDAGPKTPRYGMYPHDSEFTYICQQVQTFLSSLAPASTLLDKINKKRGARMVSVNLGAIHEGSKIS